MIEMKSTDEDNNRKFEKHIELEDGFRFDI